MSIRVKDFTTPDKYGAMVHIPDGKTGPRDIRIISSAPAISNWLSQHPTRNNKDSVLFCGNSNFNKGKSIEYNNFRKMLLKAKAKTKISKPVNPHNFRHSRATELSKKLTESILCKYMGWVIGSKEVATYIHHDPENVKNKYDEMYGIRKEDEKKLLKPIECPRCKTINDAAAKFCNGCSLGLDEKSIIEYDKEQEELKQIGKMTKDSIPQNELFQMMYERMKALEKKIENMEK